MYCPKIVLLVLVTFFAPPFKMAPRSKNSTQGSHSPGKPGKVRENGKAGKLKFASACN